jgi:hypothetical protein
MRHVGVIISAVLLAASASVRGADNDEVALKEIGITLPKSIANIKYQVREDYDDKKLGYMIGYKNAKCNISLFVYDAGNKEIPNGKDGELVAKEFKQALADIKSAEKKGLIKNLQVMEDELPLPKTVRSSFATAGMTFDIDGGGCKSYVLLLGRSDRFFKLRITQFVVNEKTNDDEVNAFLEKIVEQLK